MCIIKTVKTVTKHGCEKSSGWRCTVNWIRRCQPLLFIVTRHSSSLALPPSTVTGEGGRKSIDHDILQKPPTGLSPSPFLSCPLPLSLFLFPTKHQVSNPLSQTRWATGAAKDVQGSISCHPHPVSDASSLVNFSDLSPLHSSTLLVVQHGMFSFLSSLLFFFIFYFWKSQMGSICSSRGQNVTDLQKKHLHWNNCDLLLLFYHNADCCCRRCCYFFL